MRAEGPIDRDTWIKAAIVGGVFTIGGVAAPNILGADKNSAYPFTAKQMGPSYGQANAAADLTSERPS